MTGRRVWESKMRIHTRQGQFDMTVGPSRERSDEPVHPVIVGDGSTKGQDDGGHPSVVWFRGKAAMTRAFEREGLTFAAEWKVEGMRNPTRVYAVVNRYVGRTAPPSHFVSQTHTTHPLRRAASKLIDELRSDHATRVQKQEAQMKARFPPTDERTFDDWGDMTAHLHACVRPDQPTQVMIDIDGKPNQREWLENGGGLIAIRRALEGVFALTFPGCDAASSVHACSRTDIKPSYRIALAPSAPLFESLRDAAAFMRGCLPMLKAVGRGTVDEAWWSRGANITHWNDRLIGMSKYDPPHRVLSYQPNEKWSHPDITYPSNYLERLLQAASPDDRPLLRVAKMSGSPRKRSRESLVEDDEVARKLIERVVAREFGETIELGSPIPNVPKTAFVSHSLFCPFRECKRTNGLIDPSSKNTKRRHTKNPTKVAFGICTDRKIVFCRCFSCAVGKFGQLSQRIADLSE